MPSWNFPEINRWVNQTAQNSAAAALEEAYKGAQVIKDIEDQHFGGRAIAIQPDVGKTVADYFRTQLDRQLLRVRSNLLRLRIVGFVVRPAGVGAESQTAAEAAILEKLAFIESVVGKYRAFNDLWGDLFQPEPEAQAVNSEVVAENGQAITALDPTLKPNPTQAAAKPPDSTNSQIPKIPQKPPKTIAAKVKPVKPKQPEVMTLFGGAARIGKEFSPKYEQEVVQELRIRRSQNRMAIRWLALMLIVPIVVQVITKHLILTPLLGNYFERHPSQIELSNEIEEEFLQNFSEYRETLEVKRFLAKAVLEEEQRDNKQYKNTPEEEEALATAVYGDLSPELLRDAIDNQPGRFRSLLLTSGWTEVEEDLEEKALEEKALELWREARQEQLNGLKNVLADGAAMLAFVGLVVVGRQRLMLVRGFSNRAFLNLNDPTKVFLFILVSDMFVGFHSAEGWEVILEGIAHHFGLPESKVLINGFIATVPVIIDACIKFWIFTYLTRYSPSANAIYERMNT